MKVGDRKLIDDGATQRSATIIQIERHKGVVWLLADNGDLISQPIERRARR